MNVISILYLNYRILNSVINSYPKDYIHHMYYRILISVITIHPMYIILVARFDLLGLQGNLVSRLMRLIGRDVIN